MSRPATSMSSVARVLDNIEHRIETFQTETHSMFSRLVDRMEKSDRENNQRFAALEKGSALTGIFKPEFIVGLVLIAASLSYYVTRVETEKAAAVEKVAYLERQVETRERITKLETLLSLRE